MKPRFVLAWHTTLSAMGQHFRYTWFKNGPSESPGRFTAQAFSHCMMGPSAAHSQSIVLETFHKTIDGAGHGIVCRNGTVAAGLRVSRYDTKAHNYDDICLASFYL